jgi:HSP20 family protein
MAEKQKAEKQKKEHNGEQNRRTAAEGSGAMTQQRGEYASHRGALPLDRLRWEWDRVFDQFFQGWPSMWQQPGQNRWDLDIEDQKDKFVVRAEAPGFAPDDFDLQVRENELVLCACQSEEHAEGGERHWHRQEFYRTVPLSSGIDAEHVEAQYRNGILTVTLPKTESAKGKRIEVKS